MDEEVVGVGGGGVGSETRRKCEFILTSAQCPSSPQLEEEGGGDLLTNPPFPPTLASGEKRALGKRNFSPSFPFFVLRDVSRRPRLLPRTTPLPHLSLSPLF